MWSGRSWSCSASKNFTSCPGSRKRTRTTCTTCPIRTVCPARSFCRCCSVPWSLRSCRDAVQPCFLRLQPRPSRTGYSTLSCMCPICRSTTTATRLASGCGGTSRSVFLSRSSCLLQARGFSRALCRRHRGADTLRCEASLRYWYWCRSMPISDPRRRPKPRWRSWRSSCTSRSRGSPHSLSDYAALKSRRDTEITVGLRSLKHVGHRLAACRRIGRAAEIAGAQLLLGQHFFDRPDDGSGGFGLAEVLEHHRAGPDLPDRVGDTLPGDIGRRAVHRLEHRRKLAFRIDVARRRDADGAGAGRTEIGQNVAEQVRRHHDVELVGPEHEQRRQNVDMILVPGDVGKVFRHRLDALVPV